MKAEIINIGDELLIGQVVNTNASWLGEQLNLNGIQVTKTLTIPDKKEAILDALEANMGLGTFMHIYKAAETMQAQVVAKLLA